MTVFLAKINAELHGPDDRPRPRHSKEWEGQEIVVPRPRTLASSAAPLPVAGDEIVVWTHEGKDYGSGLGMTARAKIATARLSGDGAHLQLESVELLQPHIHLHEIAPGHSGSRAIEAIRGYTLYQLVCLNEGEAVELKEAVNRLLAAKAGVLSELRPIDPIMTALEANDAEISRAYERQFQMREVRPRQAEFRRALFNAQGRRCALSGCRVEEALEACHIVPFSEEVGLRYDPRNGLVLRADLHRLFDSLRLTIDPETLRPVFAAHITSRNYLRLIEKAIEVDVDPRLLRRHYDRFRAAWPTLHHQRRGGDLGMGEGKGP